MITGGMAERHPDLRIAFSHSGGALAILLPRLDHAWHVVPKAKQSLPHSPGTYAKRFFYDTVVFDPAALRFVADTYGVSQLIVGSDYPFAMGEKDPVAMLDRAGFPPDAVQAVLSWNAKRFLGIEKG
jgi:aminocarboxymuconate-semialdehyde decarboxylase